MNIENKRILELLESVLPFIHGSISDYRDAKDYWETVEWLNETIEQMQNETPKGVLKLDNSMFEIRLQMFRKGGSFVRKLSELLATADIENQGKLVEAFPDIFERYDAYATLEAKSEPTFPL